MRRISLGMRIDETPRMIVKEVTFLFLTVSLLSTSLAWGKESLARARWAIEEGDLEEAIAVLRERLANRPKEWDALKLKALAETGLGRYDAALRDYETILEKKPSDAEVHRDLGMLLAFKIKDRRHALIHLDHYLSLELERGDTKTLGRTVTLMRSLSAGQSKAERRAFEEILRMARRFSEEGKPDFAIRTYERVLDMQPTCVTCHESLSWLLRRTNRHREAKKHMAKARLFRENG